MQCVVPIIENTPHECDLAESLEEAMVKCVARRHRMPRGLWSL